VLDVNFLQLFCMQIMKAFETRFWKKIVSTDLFLTQLLTVIFVRFSFHEILCANFHFILIFLKSNCKALLLRYRSLPHLDLIIQEFLANNRWIPPDCNKRSHISYASFTLPLFCIAPSPVKDLTIPPINTFVLLYWFFSW